MTDQELMIKGCEFLGISEEEFWELLKKAREKYPEYDWRNGKISNKGRVEGTSFGRLFVLYRGENQCGHFSYYVCICNCKNKTITKSSLYCLRKGITKSCGCWSQELFVQRVYIHGGVGTRLFSIWKGMKSRCNCLSNDHYKNYGGRGITICQEWENDYAVFRAWALLNGYEDGLTIDRIDNDKGYFPDNCRWVTRKVQNSNRSNNRLITYDNRTQTLTQWAEEFNIHPATLTARLNKMPIDEALKWSFGSKWLNNRPDKYITRRKSGWQVRLTINKKVYCFGIHPSLDEAREKRDKIINLLKEGVTDINVLRGA